MELSISVLGNMTATLRDEPVDLGGRRQRAVLAVLVLNRGDIVPTDRLIDCVWADRPPANAAGALQAYVSHLRRRLEPGGTARARGNVIASRPPGYAVSLDPEAVDAWRFDAIVQRALRQGYAEQRDLLTGALQLWQGPAYAEYADEPWAQPETARLSELREVAREEVLAARLALGESAVLVPELEALVADQPLREKRWRLLVVALYRAHRQGDALGALRRARQTLSEQLGVDPGPALRALEAEVLAQAPSLNAQVESDQVTKNPAQAPDFSDISSFSRAPGSSRFGANPSPAGTTDRAAREDDPANTAGGKAGAAQGAVAQGPGAAGAGTLGAAGVDAAGVGTAGAAGAGAGVPAAGAVGQGASTGVPGAGAGVPGAGAVGQGASAGVPGAGVPGAGVPGAGVPGAGAGAAGAMGAGAAGADVPAARAVGQGASAGATGAGATPAGASAGVPGAGLPGAGLLGAGAARVGDGGAAAPRVERGLASGGESRGTESGSRGRDHLVDREREVAALREAAADAFAGLARLVMIEGPAGIGKSRLLTEARRIADGHGALTLTARGSQLEKEFGFGAARQLFEALLTDSAARDRLLSGAAASATAVFDLTHDPQTRGDHTFAALHGLYWLTANAAAARPLAIVVDDLQWCDTGSLRFLAYLVRRLEGLPVLVVATLRTGEQYDDEALLAELQLDPATTAVRPGPLSAGGVAELVREGLGDAAEDVFVAACHRTTSGNPLLLRQLLRALEASGVRPTGAHAGTVTAIGSRAVSSMVLFRLRRMPAASTAVARAIAVLGDGAGLPTVAALAGVDEPAAALAVAALARAEVVRHEYPIGFVHPLVRDAVYQDLPPGERQLQHERAARVLAGAAPEQIAAHLLQIPERGDPWVVEVLRAAADTAMRRGAPEGAATYLRRALVEPPDPAVRPAVLLALGQVETLNDGPAAIAHLRAAYDDPQTDPATFALVARMLIHTLIFAGPEGNAPAVARQALARLAPEFADERQAMIALERIAAYMHSGDAFIAGDFTAEIAGERLGARMLAALRAWELVARGEQREESVRLARFALDGGLLLDGDPGLFWVISGVVLENADTDAGTLWEDSIALGHTRGSLFTVLAGQLWSGWRDWQRGDLPEAAHRLSSANEQSLAWGGVPALGISYGEACLIRVLVDQGLLADARAFLDEHLDRPRVGDGIRLVTQAHAYLLIAEGRAAEALAVLPAEAVPGNPQWYEERSMRAQAYAALGRTAEAIELAEADLADMRRWGSPRGVGRALRLAGEIAGDADRLREAVDMLSGTQARLEYTRALFALGQVVEDPVDLLREALKLAEECGALALRSGIAAALTARGEDVPAEPPVQLTTGERRMLAMAEGGADEREIAQALFLTPHTVRDTLAAVRRKQASS
ncbi:BTAD domain-containing putative transcriptional regulator [Dactylosporangium sp. CA-139066]|uniref:BTAD domain-containing putative transcriptional regulator n=1 Tax=Dactylosporangium sp. CA-139066 TaxID=3239930 RepID=UPI003D946C65